MPKHCNANYHFLRTELLFLVRAELFFCYFQKHIRSYYPLCILIIRYVAHIQYFFCVNFSVYTSYLILKFLKVVITMMVFCCSYGFFSLGKRNK